MIWSFKKSNSDNFQKRTETTKQQPLLEISYEKTPDKSFLQLKSPRPAKYFNTADSPIREVILRLEDDNEMNSAENPAVRKQDDDRLKLKQQQNADSAESDKFPPFKLPRAVGNMDISHYIDVLTKFVEQHKIYFTSDAEAEEYFRKCDRRYHWGFGFEWLRILNVLRGKNIQKMVRDKQTALLNFLACHDSTTGESILNLTQTTDYCKFAQYLKNSHQEDFERLQRFLISNPSLIAYLRTIISAPNGYFPYRGATQNLVLWLCGETQCGKTSLAAIITSFLVVCKMRAANEKFMNTCGDNSIPNKALYFNIFQLEELKKSGKGAEDLMDLIDGGVSVIKGKEASGWGSDTSGDAYHFPILITSNYSPCEFFSSKHSDDTLFHEAALSRVICIEISRSTLPNLSCTNRFAVSRVALAQFVWAFVYHSEIEADMGDLSPHPIRKYEEPASVELTLQELSLPAGEKVPLRGTRSRKPDRRFEAKHQIPHHDHTEVAEPLPNPLVKKSSSFILENKVLNIEKKENYHEMIDDKVSLHNQEICLLGLHSQRESYFEMSSNKKIKFDKDCESIISRTISTASAISSSGGFLIPIVKEFLTDTALKHRPERKVFKARELYQDFALWLRIEYESLKLPTESVFGKVLGTLKGIQKIRRSWGQLYKLDLDYL